MIEQTKYYAIIPARYASTRFPAKVLALIGDKPLFWHAYRRAYESGFFEAVYVAGDDVRIEEKAHELSVPYIATKKEHPSGTDRVREAVRILNLPENCVIANVQGDEPFLTKDMFCALLSPFEANQNSTDENVCSENGHNENLRNQNLRDNNQNRYTSHPCQCSSLGILLDPVKDAHRIASPHQVKIVCGKNKEALYFSRSPIPFDRDKENINIQKAPYIGHIGIYAFTRQTLERMANFEPTPLENTEKLEQLRLLENNIRIHINLVDAAPYGVDTPQDLEEARAYYTHFTK